jgi:hypothetical protein
LAGCLTRSTASASMATLISSAVPSSIGPFAATLAQPPSTTLLRSAVCAFAHDRRSISCRSGRFQHRRQATKLRGHPPASRNSRYRRDATVRFVVSLGLVRGWGRVGPRRAGGGRIGLKRARVACGRCKGRRAAALFGGCKVTDSHLRCYISAIVSTG